MALIDDSVINLVIDAKERGLDQSRRKIEELADELRDVSAANIAASQSTDKNARSQTKLASSSGTATSGLAGLQAQLASTAAAQRALKDDTNDVGDVLDEVSDTITGYDQTVNAIADGLQDATDELDEIGDFDADLLDDFDERELRRFIRLTGGAQREMDKLMRSQDELIRSETQEEFQSQLFSVLGSGDAENFQKAFGEGFLKNAPADPTEYDRGADTPIHPLNLYQLAQRDDVSGMQDIMDLYPGSIANTLDTTLTDPEVDDAFGGEGIGISSDVIPQKLQEDFINADIRSVGDLFTRTDRELGLLARDEFETGMALPDDASIDEIKERGQGIKERMLGDLQNRSPKFQNEQFVETLEQIQDPDPGVVMQIDRSEAAEKYAGLDAEEATPAIERVSNFLQGDSKYAQENRDSKITDSVRQLENLASGNEALEEILEESDNVNQAINTLSGGPSEMIQLLEAAESGELADTFGELARFADNIDDVTDVEDLQELVTQMIRVDDPGGSITDQQVELSGFRREVYTNAISDMQSNLPGDQQGSDVPIAQETLQLELIQELMESETAERREAVSSLLEDLYADELGQMGTLFQNDELMGSQFATSLDDTLPDDFDDEVGFQIQETFQEQDMPVTQFLGEDSAGDISEVVDKAIVNSNFTGDRDRAIRRGTIAVRQSLRDVLLRVGSQAAPGLLTSLKESGRNIEDLFPSQTAVNPGEDLTDGMAPPQATADHQERQSAIEDQISFVEDLSDELTELQEKNQTTLGFRGEELLGKPRRRRGLYGILLQNTPRALSALDDLEARLSDVLGGSYEARGGSLDTGRNLRRIRNGARKTRSILQKANPLFEITSANLGALNVAFESLGKMVYKFTATLGPLVTALVGLAGAAVMAGAALGSFAAVGALGFLEQMERQMAGVSNRQEALEQLTETLGEMARQAVAPLANARLADGTTAIQFVVDIIRGGLQLLNRFSRVMAEVVSMPVVTEQLDRLARLLLSDDNGALIENLQVAMQEGLPVVVDVIIGLVTALDDLIAYGSKLINLFGGNLGPALGNIQSALGILVALGAGFINVMFILINVIGAVVSIVTEAINTILGVTGVFGLDPVTVTDLAFAFGSLFGVLKIVTAAVNILIARISILRTRLFLLTGVLFVLYDAYLLVAEGEQSFAARISENMGPLKTAITYVGVYAAQLALVAGAAYKFSGALESLSVAYGIVAGKAAILSGKLLALNTLLAQFTGAGVIGWAIAFAKAIGGIIAGFISLKGAAIAALIGAVIAIADFVYYLETGESKLHDLLDGLAEFTGIEAFSELADDLLRIYDLMEKILFINPFKETPQVRTGAQNAYESDPLPQTQQYRTAGNNAGNSSRAQSMRQQAASAAGTVINIYADGSRSDRDLARTIRSEIDTFFKRELLG